ncbi:elongation factor P maturation arginine rhamnosyltransferase EarP [Shewanella colwelliana]|uniref:elongation factor P maturation arginine rhamnosyltransferase EarP n=1 Tax=Shewanella colwelliana TaxID=23 RepID=UPI0022AF90DE|nr:elongation factor P maturation arginine rhamnosyltransferase EarP [Shewanella colwelliana]MCZ4338098.1 elongation factor P maturation arginine rhamnosyltransferase EarP [Shewanella colwelliana]
MTTNTQAQHWDIFCAVVDNYGDIGVTWRLAKQLSAEYQLTIHLWVDDLASFSHILPALDPSSPQQMFNGVTILKWDQPLSIGYTPGAVLIEAFACELPRELFEQIENCRQRDTFIPPLWLNLEYLSAEPWIEGCHGLPSLQNSGLKKYFYFPGFTKKTGGLICEHALASERDQWQSDPQYRQQLFAQLGLEGISDTDKVISVFSYETQALASLCQQWSQSDRKIHALIPKGRSLNCLAPILGAELEAVQVGQAIRYGALTIHILPMTDQDGYDRLLWSCDFNIVRGEDSFLRAQWAAKPFIWHIYPQEEDYHLIKLDAFMQVYCNNLSPEIASTWQALNLAFNQGDTKRVITHWERLNLVNLPLQQHAKQWPIDALIDADLARRLVQFVKNR